MKKWYIGLLAVVLVAAVIGQVCKHLYPGEGIYGLHMQEDWLNRDFGVEYVMDSNVYQSYRDHPDQNDGMADFAQIILVGTPTGKTFQQGLHFGQEIAVETVLKGADILKKNKEGKTFYVISADGFRKHEDGKIRCAGGWGLLQKQSRYLVFLEPTTATSIMPIRGYALVGWFFGYIKLDKEDTKAQPVSKPLTELSYDEVWDLEYIADSEKVLEEVYRAKERILAMMAAMYPAYNSSAG